MSNPRSGAISTFSHGPSMMIAAGVVLLLCAVAFIFADLPFAWLSCFIVGLGLIGMGSKGRAASATARAATGHHHIEG